MGAAEIGTGNKIIHAQKAAENLDYFHSVLSARRATCPREDRSKPGYTYEEAAERTGLSSRSIFRYETERRPTSEDLYKILSLYKSLDLYGDERFINSYLGLSPSNNSLGAFISREAVKNAFKPETFLKAVGISRTTAWRNEGTRLGSPKTSQIEDASNKLGFAVTLNQPIIDHETGFKLAKPISKKYSYQIRILSEKIGLTYNSDREK